MGSDKGSADEKPVHKVSLDAYEIDKYEVTNALYAACVDAGKCTPPHDKISFTHASYYGNPQFDNFPVIFVDWNQSKTYCEWRGARLPTEAEWEKAARGGLDGKLYPWGDDSPDCSQANSWNTAKNKGCIGDTVPVGSYAGNAYGLYDMAGNVWEWTADWYSADYYAALGLTAVNPLGPANGDYRVLRGGSWNLIEDDLRVSFLLWYTPGSRDINGGFRCAR